MITIIHGDDMKKSRDFFTSLKQESESIILLEGGTVDLTNLNQSLFGEGLFNENKTVVIEQLLTKKKKSKELDELVATIKSNSEKNIILWEGKDLEKRPLSLFPNANIKSFKLPQVLFSFLDSIKPGNGEELVRYFHAALLTLEPEILFTMIVRQVRILLALANDSDDPIEELKRLAPWQKQKLKKQASLFLDDHLTLIYQNLLEIDLKQKTGQEAYPLTSSIDFLLLKL